MQVDFTQDVIAKNGLRFPLRDTLIEGLLGSNLPPDMRWPAKRLADELEKSDSVDMTPKKIEVVKAMMAVWPYRTDIAVTIECLLWPDDLAESDKAPILARYGNGAQKQQVTS